MRNEISVLAIPPDILDKLHRRAKFAAEVPTLEPEMRAFIVVIPKVTVPEPTTHNLSPVLGYEILYILHREKYTNYHYGWDDDKVLADTTTRFKRVFVKREPNEGALISALYEWLTDLFTLQRPHEFDSALIHQPGDYLNNQIDKFPHLALE